MQSEPAGGFVDGCIGSAGKRSEFREINRLG
jgi:hypothetical protein